MKVQDVKKECLANVGLSIEFSNSEIGEIDHLLWDVDRAINKAVDQQIQMIRGFEGGTRTLKPGDDVPVAIDLKNMKRIQWLLYQMTRCNHSDLFSEAYREYEAEISSINNSITTLDA